MGPGLRRPQRPWGSGPRPAPLKVLLNCAASLDGRLALPGGAARPGAVAAGRGEATLGTPLRISGPEDLARVHRLRAEVDGVLVGVNTVIADDPSLLVKWDVAGLAPGRQPARVVLDSRLRTPKDARVRDGRARLVLVAAEGADGLKGDGADVVVAGKGRVDLREALVALEALGLKSLLVEGGGTVLAAFLDAGLWDRLTVYQAPMLLGPKAPSLYAEDRRMDLPAPTVERLGEGTLLTFTRSRT